MQRSGLGSELDIDCLVATLCLETMISWLHYVLCYVVCLQMKIITGLAKISGNKSSPPLLLTNSAAADCRHCEAHFSDLPDVSIL